MPQPESPSKAAAGHGPLSNEQSKSSSSSDIELLPTYEQSNDVDEFPEVTATPEEVREFLRRLLIAKRNLTAEHADRVAAKWTTGTGQELRGYPPLMYFEVFVIAKDGREDGWAVYKEAKLCMFICERKKRINSGPTTIAEFCGGFVLWAGADSICVFYLVKWTKEDPKERSGLRGFCMWALVIFFSLILLGWVCYCISSQPPLKHAESDAAKKLKDLEKQREEGWLKSRGDFIERELQECIREISTPQNRTGAR